jgi:hypothetical protein
MCASDPNERASRTIGIHRQWSRCSDRASAATGLPDDETEAGVLGEKLGLQELVAARKREGIMVCAAHDCRDPPAGITHKCALPSIGLPY